MAFYLYPTSAPSHGVRGSSTRCRDTGFASLFAPHGLDSYVIQETASSPFGLSRHALAYEEACRQAAYEEHARRQYEEAQRHARHEAQQRAVAQHLRSALLAAHAQAQAEAEARETQRRKAVAAAAIEAAQRRSLEVARRAREVALQRQQAQYLAARKAHLQRLQQQQLEHEAEINRRRAAASSSREIQFDPHKLVEEAIGLFGHFFGLERDEEQQQAKEPVEQRAQQAQPATISTASASIPPAQEPAAAASAAADPIEVDVSQQPAPPADNSSEDPKEVDVAASPAPTSLSEATAVHQAGSADVTMTDASSAEAQPSTSTSSSSEEKLLFSYPHAPPSTLRASDLDISLSTAGDSLSISGLWPSKAPSSPTLSATSSTSSRRGRSPRRTVVRDVDEKGEEIVAPEEETDDGFVEVQTAQSQRSGIKQQIKLDTNVDRNSIRADLSDQGLKIWARTNQA